MIFLCIFIILVVSIACIFLLYIGSDFYIMFTDVERYCLDRYILIKHKKDNADTELFYIESCLRKNWHLSHKKLLKLQSRVEILRDWIRACDDELDILLNVLNEN